MTPAVQDEDFTLYCGDVREVLAGLPDESVHCCVTSPPYLDVRPDVATLTAAAHEQVFRELTRVVTGSVLYNVGRVFRGRAEHLWWLDILTAAQRAGYSLLDTLVWVKPNANPIHGEVLADSHEYVLVFGDPGTPLNTDAVRTDYDEESIARFTRRYRNGGGVKGEVREQDGREQNEEGARARSFFIAYVGREKGNDHPTPMCEALAEHLVLLASWSGETVLDPFMGSGTTALVARRHGRKTIGIELNPDYCALAARRLQQLSLLA